MDGARPNDDHQSPVAAVQDALHRFARFEQTQETLLREFLACDLDEDGSVPNSTEVPEFLQESFGLLDHDGSGEVSREEIESFLAGLLLTQAQLESTRMTMQIHEETRGLYSTLQCSLSIVKDI